MLDPSLAWNKIQKNSSDFDTRLTALIFVGVISVAFFQFAYAQTEPDPGKQVSLSDELLQDPLAQDILNKIEQTKKMINDLEQKEYEQNQAQENLQKMRDESIKRLDKNLKEWERLWEKHTSRNSFENFVNKKPSYVQGVFWDQFEFKEQKVLAGRLAMSQVLTNGGTIQDAKDAYNKAATTHKIELIEMNSQFNVKHNLADYQEQQLFNSTGQVHMSSATGTKLANMYSDYKLQPSYILANSNNDRKALDPDDSGASCSETEVLVSRVTSGTQSCVDESTAKKWIDNGVKGIKVSGTGLSASDVATNPATICNMGHQVVYDVANLEYRCVSDETANEMIQQKSAEVHTLVDYIQNKDQSKIQQDAIYEVNQKIKEIVEHYSVKLKMLDSEYEKMLENEDLKSDKVMQEIVKNYRDGKITKSDVSEKIADIKNNSNKTKQKILDEKSKKQVLLETEKKERMTKAVKGYENNPEIDVDWAYLNDISSESGPAEIEQEKPPGKLVSYEKIGHIRVGDVGIVNSFGHEFDEIKTDHVLQIAADITNLYEGNHDFAYVVEIQDGENDLTYPPRWITGTLNPDQTFNVSLSWIPEKTGTYAAVIYAGESMNSVSQVAKLDFAVSPEGEISDDSYCKTGHELLFKYSDNSPICASAETASKLINIGLAFA